MKFPIQMARMAMWLGAAALAACGGSSSDAPTEVEWLTDPGAAFQLAQQKHRAVLIAFVGSNWSAPSQAVKTEIFDTQAFKDFSDANLVLLQVDFPRKGTSAEIGVPAELKQNYEDMIKNVQLNSLPTFLLVDAGNGAVAPASFGRFSGYWPGGPEVFIQNLTAAIVRRMQQAQAAQAQPGPAQPGPAQPLAPMPTAPVLPTALPVMTGLPSAQDLVRQQMFQVPQMPSTVSAGAVNPSALPSPDQLVEQLHPTAPPQPVNTSLPTPEQLMQQQKQSAPQPTAPATSSGQPAPAQPANTGPTPFNFTPSK